MIHLRKWGAKSYSQMKILMSQSGPLAPLDPLLTEALPKMGYYIRDSCILMRWSYSLHLGQGTAVCDLDIENTVA